MNNNHRFILEKYSGTKSRYTCPKCGRKHTFTRYIDTENNNNYISDIVGKCDRLDKCGYHYTPKEYFTDNPQKQNCLSVENIGKSTNKHFDKTPQPVQPQPICYFLPDFLASWTINGDSAFRRWLVGRFGEQRVEHIFELYKVGGILDRVVFWQWDYRGRLRTGKVMIYDSTGHRAKVEGAVNWVHAMLKSDGSLHRDWELKQCLFGEHLLPQFPKATVAVVESAKSALVGALLISGMVWVSVEGLMGLNSDKLSVLQGRNTIFFPDEGMGYKVWSERVPEIAEKVGFNYRISSFMEGRERGSDIADL